MSRIKIADKERHDLRERLDEIAGISLQDIKLHRERVEALNAVYPHGIKYIDDGGGDRCDCMLYVFEIPVDLVKIAGLFHDIIDEFFGVALPGMLDQTPDSEVSERRIIVYFKEGTAKHVGRVKEGRVISKWGKNPIYEHGITEVPASYGDEYEFFKQPSVSYVTNNFFQFVRRHSRYIDFSEIFEQAVVETGYAS
ncbi:MAG: hypothetical protein ACM3TN_16775 [Alphaproteobacteria bacterium]